MIRNRWWWSQFKHLQNPYKLHIFYLFLFPSSGCLLLVQSCLWNASCNSSEGRVRSKGGEGRKGRVRGGRGGRQTAGHCRLDSRGKLSCQETKCAGSSSASHLWVTVFQSVQTGAKTFLHFLYFAQHLYFALSESYPATVLQMSLLNVLGIAQKYKCFFFNEIFP